MFGRPPGASLPGVVPFRVLSDGVPTLATIDASFFVPRPLVAIVALGDSGEALLLRAILENLGAAVALHLPGVPADVIACFAQGSVAPAHLIVSGHGDENGLVLGEFGPGIDTSDLVDGSLPPAALHGRVDLPGTIVVSTACETGSPAFADAFLSGGAASYVAPGGYPEGAAVPLFVHLLYHELLRRGSSVDSAVRRAQSVFTPDEALFALFAGDRSAEEG